MGYRIDYSQDCNIPAKKKRFPKLSLYTAVFFLLFLLLTGKYWNQGSRILRELFLPGDAAVTAAAIQDLTSALKTGQSFSDAFAAFCFQVIQGAGLSLG